MKRFPLNITLIITAALLSLAPQPMTAQDYVGTPVTVSKEKVRIDGRVCYSHIVLEKQTLYSICKAYNASIEDIYRYNPSVKEQGLKKNSILIIPAASDEPEVTAQDRKPVQHPKRKTHVVKWYEDIEGIAARYGVTPGAIMKANELTGKKLAKRQKLIIPNPGEYPENEIAEVTEETAVHDTVSTTDSAAQTPAGRRLFSDFFFPKKEINVSLLLPLKATGETSNRQNMDFYSGILLAAYDMYKEGLSTNLNVYDIADGAMPIELDLILDSDIIIGPVASGDISRIFEAVPQINALVSPLDPRAEGLAYSKKMMIHAPTPHRIQHNDLVSWIREDMKAGDRLFMITEKGARQTDAVTSMISAMNSSGLEYKPLSYSILEGRNVTDTLVAMMTDSLANRVYIASESEAFVNDVVRNLNVMIHQKYDVVLYAPSKIRSFETIEVENFHNTNMHVSAGYYIDYNDPKTKEFLLKYRALFNTEPIQFAYQGYDLGRYFFTLCSKYGSRWMEKLDETDSKMLQSSFDFIRTPEGGYINNGVRRIVYGDNWKVETIR